MFYVTITRNFEPFLYFNFETNFLTNGNTFQKTGAVFRLKVIRLKTQHFHTKLPFEKPMLRQIELGGQNGRITKKGILALITLIFLEILFQFENLLYIVDLIYQLP